MEYVRSRQEQIEEQLLEVFRTFYSRCFSTSYHVYYVSPQNKENIEKIESKLGNPDFKKILRNLDLALEDPVLIFGRGEEYVLLYEDESLTSVIYIIGNDKRAHKIMRSRPFFTEATIVL